MQSYVLVNFSLPSSGTYWNTPKKYRMNVDLIHELAQWTLARHMLRAQGLVSSHCTHTQMKPKWSSYKPQPYFFSPENHLNFLEVDGKMESAKRRRGCALLAATILLRGEAGGGGGEGTLLKGEGGDGRRMRRKSWPGHHQIQILNTKYKILNTKSPITKYKMQKLKGTKYKNFVNFNGNLVVASQLH